MAAIMQNINPNLLANISLSELRLMERKILGGVYNTDNIENRIARLEQAMLGMNQSGALDIRFQKLKNTMRNITHANLAPYQGWQPTNTTTALKNIFGNILGNLGTTITGITPPIYDNYYNTSYPYGYDSNEFFKKNNAFYNNAGFFHAGSNVHIMD